MDDVAIAQWVASQTGIDPAILGDSRLRRAIDRRHQLSGESSPHRYLQLLRRSEQEQQALVELLVVPETWFFRDRSAFAALARLAREQRDLPADQPPLRLLSAPCSSGEEPYSMAMTLLEQGLPASRFRIDAIDISLAALDRARRATYGRHAFRGVQAAERQRFFQPAGQGWALRPEIRDCVQFRQGNLLHCLRQISTLYDVVFCRNLLIYLHDGAIESLLSAIAGLLRPGGLLLVGAAEMARVPPSRFEPQRQPESFAFRRRLDEPETPAPLAASAVGSASFRAASSNPVTATTPIAPAAAKRGPAGASTAAAGPGVAGPGSDALAELERCRRLLSRDPTAVAVHLRMAELWIAQRDPQQAERCLRKGLYLQPHSREILRRLIAVHRSMGNSDERQRFQDRLARLEP